MAYDPALRLEDDDKTGTTRSGCLDADPYPARRAATGFDGSPRWIDGPFFAIFDRPATYAIGAGILSVLGAATTLLAPRLLDPAAFGVFALLTSLFLYAGKTDLGLSQLADREIAVREMDLTESAIAIMRLLWITTLTVILVGASAGYFGAGWMEASPTATVLAITGGALAMVANGPATIHRAASHVRQFTVIALTLQAGLTFPRLLGLIYGGVTGCFTALAIWYGILSIILAKPGLYIGPRRIRARKILDVVSVLRAGIPLFAFNALWLFYLTSNRWFATFVNSSVELGLFALGTSLSFVGLSIIATVAQVRYPRLLSQMRSSGPHGASALLEREILIVTSTLALVGLIAIYTTPHIVPIAFPGYEAAIQSVVALAAGTVSLGALAWTMPMAIVLSRNPGTDATWLFIPALVILASSIFVGHRLGGITGQSWACMAAFLFLFVLYVRLLGRLGSLTTRAARKLICVQSVLAAILVVLSGPAWAQGPTNGRALVFEDDFAELKLWTEGREGEGGWEPHYPWGDRSNADNSELQYYVDPRPGRDMAEIVALTPFALSNGVLSIRAEIIPPSLRFAAQEFAYSSGMLTTYRWRNFTYGYFEMRARMPKGQGFWPAFWLIPMSREWPPELDVMEFLGDRTDRFHVHVHTAQGPSPIGRDVPAADLTRSFNVFGVSWTPETIDWYFNDSRVFSTATPADMHEPMYLVVNLAVGGEWPGSPDEHTHFPSMLDIDWIRVWQQPAVP